MGARIEALVVVGSLAGCCATSVSGKDLESNTGGASSTGGGASSSGSSSGGSSTGFPALAPGILLDATARQVFGPVALSATVAPKSFGAAKLAYSIGDFQQFDITAQALLGDAGPMGDPITMASTSFGFASPPPNLTISEDGMRTSVLWEDFGTPAVPLSCVRASSVGPIVLGAWVSEGDSTVNPWYSDCGSEPSLLFNPIDHGTRLVYAGDHPQALPPIVEWRPYPQTGQSCFTGLGYAASAVTAPAGARADLTLLKLLDAGSGNPQPPGLSLLESDYGQACTAISTVVSSIDPSLLPEGVFAATSSIENQLVGVVELDGLGLRSVQWSLDAGTGLSTRLVNPEAVTGPVAAATCAGGFAYLAMLDGGALSVSELDFGGTLQGATRVFSLQGFNSVVTSLAATPNGDAGVFVAVSSTTQLGVYLAGCP